MQTDITYRPVAVSDIATSSIQQTLKQNGSLFEGVFGLWVLLRSHAT
jgi:hypothetical protein